MVFNAKKSDIAVYVRRSTDGQTDEHQRDDIGDWLERHELGMADVELFVDTGSGADGGRKEFLRLIDAVEDGELTDVVVWEISRIARKGVLAQQFFDACENADVVIHVTNGSVREIKPDGTGRMVAGIIAEVAAEERRNLIRRTKSGQKRARKEGKWMGQVPAGFERVDGYLRVNLEPDYEDGETGYYDIVSALEDIEDGASYRSVAERTPNVTRQTLSTIYQDEERQQWYLGSEADDERVEAAVEAVR
ncbi:recombinase family protein [Halorubrum sp. DTA46]|uniref:recombinase family protein n=1 Tax=Halorubrum sp. DTA46 TaxID=3402162 RepID=UPI003AAC343A